MDIEDRINKASWMPYVPERIKDKKKKKKKCKEKYDGTASKDVYKIVTVDDTHGSVRMKPKQSSSPQCESLKPRQI